MTNLNNSLSR